MASLYRRGDVWVVDQVVAGRTRTIRLGKVPRRAAEKAKRHIESIAGSLLVGDAPTPEDRAWIGSLDDRVRAKLVNAGLCEPSTAPAGLRTLGDLPEALPRLMKPGSASGTLRMYRETTEMLLRVLGPRLLGQIGQVDALTFDEHLHDRGIRAGTVQKHRRVIKAVFNMLKRAGVIESNPFGGLRSESVPASPDLQQYIPVKDALRVMEHADAGTRLLIALARFGAHRVSSEAFKLRWSDVRLDESVLIVPDKKRKVRRQVPITGVLRDELVRAAGDREPDPGELVVTGSSHNLERGLNKAWKRAGVKRWKRAYQNLRASCETDIRQHAPAHIASMIVGHSRRVGDDHYDLGRGRWISGLAAGLNSAWSKRAAHSDNGRVVADGSGTDEHCGNRCTSTRHARASRDESTRSDWRGFRTSNPQVAGSNPARDAC